MEISLEAAKAVRLRLHKAGFSPIPVNGKKPLINGWSKMGDASAEQLARIGVAHPDHLNTGLITAHMPTIDIDILDPDAAEACEHLVRDRFGDAGQVLVRIGLAPKRAIPFRTDQPFDKILVALVGPNRTEQKIELLCDGQQVVADGIHPDTQRPYIWINGAPGDVTLADLPYLIEADAKTLVDDVVELLIAEHGYTRKPERPNGHKEGNQRKEGNGQHQDGNGHDDWSWLFGEILDGASLHDATLSLAAKLVSAGVKGGAAVNIIRAAMERSKAPRDDRFHERLRDIPRLVSSAESRFGNNQQGPQPGESRWRDDLLLTPTKTPRAMLANAVTALRGAPEWTGVLAYDEFAGQTMAMKPPPWIRTNSSWSPRSWGDADDTLATDWLHHQNIGIAVNVTANAVQAVAQDRTFHPIRDFLNGLKWDGDDRVAGFAHTYLGAEDTPYHRSIGQCFLIGAVARIMRPGCKMDYIPILEGDQGEGKSTAIERLFTPWFTDDLAELGSKDAAMQVRAAWGIEIGELSSMTRGEIERVKAFISRKTDRFRPSYGRHVIEVPRQSVFIGSTNDDEYLKDATGARRFWPIKCGAIKLSAIAHDRDQLWAEAVALFERGVPWWITDASTTLAAKEEQAARYVEDAWDSLIEGYVRGKADVSVPEVLNFLIPDQAKWGQREQQRVGRSLKNLGWSKYRAREGAERACRYRRSQVGHT